MNELRREKTPYLLQRAEIEAGTRYYLCRDGSCRSPADSMEELERRLQEEIRQP